MDGGTNFILRIKEQETRLTLQEHDDDDDEEEERKAWKIWNAIKFRTNLISAGIPENPLLSLLNSAGNLEVTEFLQQICSCDLSFTELCSIRRNGRMFLLSCSILRQKQRIETKRSRLITPWSRFLLEKLTGFQLVKKFPTFYGTRRFITAFTTARPLL